MAKVKPVRVGIDAANLRGGGGVTHLVELLRHAQPVKYGIEQVVLWGGEKTLSVIYEQHWLIKRNPLMLDKGLLYRTLWQRFYLSQAARDEGCDVLFVPGGSYAGNFHPVVTMSQNLLPFDMRELQRYGWTLFALKLLLLRMTQSRSFQEADGVIFLTQYAQDVVVNVTGQLGAQASIIPHGLNQRFNSEPKLQQAMADYDDAHPYHVLYVSIIDCYKHQWHVVEAVAKLRKQGFPVILDLVGPAYPPALQQLSVMIAREDPERQWVHYHGAIEFDALHHYYMQADLGLFASSCENMPNILLETMAAGLPIACSKRGPMPEMLGEAGIYFDPEQPEDIARALRELMDAPSLRAKLAHASYTLSQQYSWQRCADETFDFIAAVMQENRGTIDV